MNIINKLFYLLLKSIGFAFVWFVSFILVALLAPVSEDGTLTTISALCVIFLPFIAAGLSMRLKIWITARERLAKINFGFPLPEKSLFKNTTLASENPTPSEAVSCDSQNTPPQTPTPETSAINSGVNDCPTKPKLPFSRRKRIENVEALVSDAVASYELALRSDSASLFVLFWNSTASTLDELKKYKGSVPDSCFDKAPQECTLKKNFLWKLRDAMEREGKVAIADIRGEHHNNKKGRFEDLRWSFEHYSDRYDDETISFACGILTDIAKAAGIKEFSFCGKEIVITQEEIIHNTNNLDNIDFMEGHEFEYWCAKLLADIGFTDVNVTQGSGDQGVDVLACKDGIRYAIQCKCYSKDLGNSPIQEVTAGKKIYHCQIGAVMTNRHFTKGAKEAAAANDIFLWDRDWIANAIRQRNANRSVHQ